MDEKVALASARCNTQTPAVGTGSKVRPLIAPAVPLTKGAWVVSRQMTVGNTTPSTKRPLPKAALMW